MHSGPRLTALSVTAAAALLLGAAGCTDLDQASAAGISHDDLLSETSIQLARVTGLTYTATYQLAGGGTATVTQAQKPSRTAYVYPGGRLIQTATGTVRCSGAKTGSTGSGGSGKTGNTGPGSTGPGSTGPEAAGPGTAGPGTAGPGTAGPGTAGPGTAGPGNAGGAGKTGSAGGSGSGGSGKAAACTETDPAPATAAPLAGSTLITPEAALALLNTAALDQKVNATQHDTTIAGRHALCLDLDNVDGTPTRRFSLCVTNEGALGSFAATIAGTHYEQALTTYTEKVAPDAFDLPPSAKLTDKRTKTK
ncbi:hypothetical protein [Actinoplanes subtropicus]|uniref:hypothetical protein n=1 Tax=Actinoplanes subtropicus TaxID=543632 RepID=UPI00068F235C|nr:hypothetical protein [Actinoplanes subtropicus]